MHEIACVLKILLKIIFNINYKIMKRLFLLMLGISLFVGIFFCPACKKTDDPGTDTPDWTDEEQQAYEHVLNLQDDVSTKLDDWLTSMDSLEAINLAQQEFANDPAVTSATISIQGITVQYTNGIRGGIFINGKKFNYKKGMATMPYNKNIKTENNLNCIVNNRKMLLLDAANTEFSYYTDQVYSMSYQNLGRVGISITDYPRNSEVSLDQLSQLSGYGIIDLESHGLAWPKETNITDVYFLTGEEANVTTTKKYWDDLTKGSIPIVKMFTRKSTKKTMYYISADFIKKHNDFSQDTVLFYGGFCYSFLGDWPDIVDGFADGAYLGFDWSVESFHCANWDLNMLALLSDTTKEVPMNLEAWMNDTDVEKSYFDNEDNRTVHIYYTGDGTLRLWSKNKISLMALSPDGAPVSTPGKIDVAYPFRCVAESGSEYVKFFWDIGDGSAPVSASNEVNITWSEAGQYILEVEVVDYDDTSLGTATLAVSIVEEGNNEVRDFVLTTNNAGCRFGPQTAVQFSPPATPGGNDYIGWNSEIEWSGSSLSGISMGTGGNKVTFNGSISDDGQSINFVVDLEYVSEFTGNIFKKYTLTVSNCPFSYYGPDAYPYPEAGYSAFPPDIQNYVTNFSGYYVDEVAGTTHTVTGIDWSSIDKLTFVFYKE
jgi:hypothetical protein